MTSFASVVILAFASFLILNQCGDGQAGFVYMVCFPRTHADHLERPVTGFIQMGSGRTEAKVSLTTIRVRYSLTMRPYTFERMSSEAVGITHLEGANRLTLSIVSSSELLVTCGTSRYPSFDDTYAVYPIAPNDKKYMFPYSSKHFRFAALLGVEQYTKVKIVCAPLNNKPNQREEISFTIYKYLAYYWPNNFRQKERTISSIEALDGRIAVFAGNIHIQASLRPVQSFGKHFMIVGLPGRNVYNLLLFSPSDADSFEVSLEDEKKTKIKNIRVPKNSAEENVKVQTVVFHALIVQSELHPVALAVNYRKTLTSPPFTFFLTPSILLASMKSYAVCIPYAQPEPSVRGARMLTLIGKYPGTDNILVNGHSLTRWTNDSFFVTSKNGVDTYASWRIAHNQTLTIWARPNSAGHLSFAVYLYAQSQAGTYFTEARGLGDSSKQKIYDPDYGTPAGTRPGSSYGTVFTRNRQGSGPEWRADTHIYIIASIPRIITKEHSFGGTLTISCYRKHCNVEFARQSETSHKVVSTITIAAHKTKKETFEVMDKTDGTIFTTLTTKDSISVMVEFTDQDQLWQVVGIYPLLREDTFFVMAVPSETKFILIVPRNDDVVQVRISIHKTYAIKYQYKQFTKTILRNKGYIWVSTKIKGQVPSFKRYGRDFILFRSNHNAGWATAYAPGCAVVVWTIHGRKVTMKGKKLPCARYCTRPQTIEFRDDWDYMRIMSTSNIIVQLRYESPGTYFTPDQLPTRFVKPMEEYSSEYILDRPFIAPYRVPDQQLCFIAKVGEIGSITVNGGSAETFLVKAQEVYDIAAYDFKAIVRVWAAFPLSGLNTLHFKSTGGAQVKFSIVVYNYFERGQYATELHGFTDYKPRNDEWRYGMQVGKLDKCDRYYEYDTAHLDTEYLEKDDDSLLYKQRTVVVLSVVGSFVALLLGATVYSICQTRT